MDMAEWTDLSKKAVSHAITIAIFALATMHTPTHLGLAAAPGSSLDLAFDLPAQAGAKKAVDFKVTTPGCIEAFIRPWSSSTSGNKANQLQLSLYGSDRTTPYVSITGASSAVVPLWLSYAAFPLDVNRVNTWTVTVSTVNGRGSARGVVRVDFPPNQMPCALRATTTLTTTTNVTNTTRSVNLSWLYTGSAFDGLFLVERSSNNGAAWRAVRGCAIKVSTRTLYSCSDANVGPGEYLYRACSVSTDASDSMCSASNVTPAVRVSIK